MNFVARRKITNNPRKSNQTKCVEQGLLANKFNQILIIPSYWAFVRLVLSTHKVIIPIWTDTTMTSRATRLPRSMKYRLCKLLLLKTWDYIDRLVEYILLNRPYLLFPSVLHFVRLLDFAELNQTNKFFQWVANVMDGHESNFSITLERKFPQCTSGWLDTWAMNCWLRHIHYAIATTYIRMSLELLV